MELAAAVKGQEAGTRAQAEAAKAQVVVEKVEEAGVKVWVEVARARVARVAV